MIDPENVTKYDRKDEELEEFIIFCVMVAGHNAHSTARALNAFLSPPFRHLVTGSLACSGLDAPFSYIRSLLAREEGEALLLNRLKRARVGCHSRAVKFLKEITTNDVNLRSCSYKELETFHGIGPKTARFFILHTRKGVDDIAVLDTHLLKWLKSKGHDVPKSTPSGRRYLALEQIVVREAKASGMTPAEFDLNIWKTYRKAPKE